MSKPTFKEWLALRVDRKGPLADFTEDVASDPAAPDGGRDEWLEYLERHGAPDHVVVLFKSAWRAYVRSQGKA
jgi:hypothetical protein